MNRLAFNENQLERISNLKKQQKELLSILTSALAIDSLYIFNRTKREHPLSDNLCNIADELRKKANITTNEYNFLCGKLGLMELDEIINFVIKKI
jgi:hypothetical protein